MRPTWLRSRGGHLPGPPRSSPEDPSRNKQRGPVPPAPSACLTHTAPSLGNRFQSLKYNHAPRRHRRPSRPSCPTAAAPEQARLGAAGLAPSTVRADSSRGASSITPGSSRTTPPAGDEPPTPAARTTLTAPAQRRDRAPSPFQFCLNFPLPGLRDHPPAQTPPRRARGAASPRIALVQPLRSGADVS